ncbi:Zinc finger MYM-type protein 5-like [Homarus americanus]|uniref:Zinc finger MYM-type protein 5-like n=5 Tax=Homarus americanus TaxID=6706 RepID=A0A8J5MPX5_HOMAM|nr:Zinc finger MYM-type protein 5-like [Homarus americanus]
MASTSRDRGRGRKYLNGNQKRALAKAKVLENEKHRGAIKKFLVTPPLKRPCIEDEEDKNDSENDNTAISPITVDEYNEEIDIQFEKVQVDTQTQLNQTEDDLNTTEDSAKVRSPLIAKEESEGQAQTSNSDGSSTSTVVININDDPASWPSNINRNIRDYLTMKGPPDIPVNKFPRNEKGLCFSKFHCKRKLPNGE